MRVVFFILILIFSSQSFSFHIAKFNIQGKWYSVGKAQPNTEYMLLHSKPICFKYKQYLTKAKKVESYACKSDYTSDKESNIVLSSKKRKIPLGIVLDHCNFDFLQKIELTKKDIKKNITQKLLIKKYLYQKAYRFKSRNNDLFVFTGIVGKLDDSILKLPEGKIHKVFIIKDLRRSKMLITDEAVCCDPETAMNNGEYFKEECLAKMIDVKTAFEDKKTGHVYFYDTPAGNEGYHFRISEILSDSVKTIFHKAIYAVGGCELSKH